MNDFKREQHETAGIIGSAVLAMVAAMEAHVEPDAVHPGLPRGWRHGFDLQRRVDEASRRVTYCVRFPNDGGEPGAWDDTVTLAFTSAVQRLRVLHAGEVERAEQHAVGARKTAAAIDAALREHGR